MSDPNVEPKAEEQGEIKDEELEKVSGGGEGYMECPGCGMIGQCCCGV